jgi:nucleotide-binding universal stress UspA family protein
MSAAPNVARVLVGVDFDEASASALKMAGALASAWGAEITAFHSATQEAPAYFTAAQMASLEAERQHSLAGTADRLRAFAEPHVGRAVHVVVSDGPPQDALLRRAASFDLIVVGTHRRHGVRRWWLGSVAEAIVRHSPSPVLVVAAGAVVPEARRGTTIVAAAGEDGAADAWVNALRTAFGGTVIRSADISQCPPDRLQKADLIVLSMPADGTHSQLGVMAHVLKECVRPVLFVPSVDGIVKGSTS